MVQRSIEVLSSETPFDRLPGDIREALRPEEAVVYQTGPSYFAERADQCAPKLSVTHQLLQRFKVPPFSSKKSISRPNIVFEYALWCS